MLKAGISVPPYIFCWVTMMSSLKDIVETLKREPRHFGALSGRAYILMKQNKNRQAIETINEALKIHPFLSLRHTIPNIQNSQPL